MTLCTSTQDLFPNCKSKKIDAAFDGGNVSSFGGMLLLRQADQKLGLIEQAANCFTDGRRKRSCDHSVEQMLRQRVFGLAAGEEDLNDHDELRHDLLVQTAVERDEALASSATLCRFENLADRAAAVKLHELLVDQFIASHTIPPKELVLDFDATDNPLHGMQEGRFFHGYYDRYCLLPLYVFCGDQILTAYLRPSNKHGAMHAWAILSLLVKRFREVWPGVRIIFRADSGFCRWRMLRWMDKNDVGYCVGVARNPVLARLGEEWSELARERHEQTGDKHQVIGEFMYAAGSWDRDRRVIIRAEHGSQGRNPRFIVSNIDGEPEELYRKLYCARGDMENRIKEQMQLFSARSSAHRWWANQLRLLLSALAYVLLERMRTLALSGTRLAKAECRTLREKLLKIGAVVTRNTRRIRIHLSERCTCEDLFWRVAEVFASG